MKTNAESNVNMIWEYNFNQPKRGKEIVIYVFEYCGQIETSCLTIALYTIEYLKDAKVNDER